MITTRMSIAGHFANRHAVRIVSLTPSAPPRALTIGPLSTSPSATNAAIRMSTNVTQQLQRLELPEWASLLDLVDGVGCVGKRAHIAGSGPHMEPVDARGARKPALHAAERRRGDLGDLLVAQTLCVSQNEDDTDVVGRGLGAFARGARSAPSPRGARPARAATTPRARPGTRGRRVCALAREVIERGVVSDVQQPRVERSVAADGAEAVEGTQKGILADVLGVLGCPRFARRRARRRRDGARRAARRRAEPLVVRRTSCAYRATGGSVVWFRLTPGLTAEAASGLHRFARRDRCLTFGRVHGLETALDLETNG